MKKPSNISNVNTAMSGFWGKRNMQVIDMNVYIGWFVMYVVKTFEDPKNKQDTKAKIQICFQK